MVDLIDDYEARADTEVTVFYMDIQNVYNYKSDEVPIIARAEDSDGNYLPASGDPRRYPLREIKNMGSGTILPTIGLIIDI